MTIATSDTDLINDIHELNHMLTKWGGETGRETKLGRELVRQAIARNQAKLQALRETNSTKGEWHDEQPQPSILRAVPAPGR